MRRVLDLGDQDEARAATVLGLVVAVVILTASGVLTVRVRGDERATPAALSPATRGDDRTATSARAIAPGASPLRVRIPAIAVDAPLVPLGLNGDGTLQVPGYGEAGWYAGGSRPGEAGPAVIAAHVDSTTGPAVFHRLGDVEPGNEVYVDYGDVTVSFVVRHRERVRKSQFPTDQVYGPTETPKLRLVTCAGAFDRKTGTYAVNLIVWADALSPALAEDAVIPTAARMRP